MRKYWILIITGLMPFGLFSQKIFVVENASQADVKIMTVDYLSQADVSVYKEEIVSQVKGNRGIWHFTDIQSEADKKVMFVEFASQADLKVYFVDYRSQAGWVNKKKAHLLSSPMD